MRSFKLIIVVAILFMSGGHLFSQDKGIVKFFVDVDNGYFEIELNDTMLLRRYKDTLPAGNYTAKIWSPGYVVKPIDFTVVSGQVTEQHVEMVKNNNFLDYERAYNDYRMQFHKQLTVPATVSLASALTTGVFMVNAYTTRKKVTSDIELYFKSPVTSELDVLKTQIADNNKRYNRQRNAFYVGTGLTFAFVGVTIWSYKNFNKNYTEPTYIKESPFKEKYALSLTPNGCSFTINL